MTPKEFLISYVNEFNAKNVNSLLNMYEAAACFVVQPEQIVKGTDNIRQSLQGFVDMNGKLQSDIKGVIQTNNLALVTTKWSFSGTGPDGKSINIAGKATDVLRQQPDSTWRIIIDNPWGTEI
jgi:ketosteroid isomerase-like protein